MGDLRRLPKVDVLSESSALAGYPLKVRVAAARHAIDYVRDELRAGRDTSPIEQIACSFASAMMRPTMVEVINATGVVLHTGLGRARLSPEAAQAAAAAAHSHSNLEFDLDTGKRGDRKSHVRDMLCEMTGCEDALVVNNCAAALFLSLRALASRKEVILSRGQMVEIGGSFRMPDIVRESGCKLVEVGTTNRTRLADYEAAITPRTAAILRCHPSNFKVVGFTQEPSAKELSQLCQSHGLKLIDDVGSGLLIDSAQFGLPQEPTLRESVEAGADVVTASGDKMLGGPQAGIILGSRDAIAKIRKHPLARAVRIDKLSLAALEATLRLYKTGQEGQIPTVRYLSRPINDLHAAAQRLADAFPGDAVVEEGTTEVGGGSLPGSGIPTWRAGLSAKNANVLSKALRQSNPPLIARIEGGIVWLDPRTMEEHEIEAAENILSGLDPNTWLK